MNITVHRVTKVTEEVVHHRPDPVWHLRRIYIHTDDGAVIKLELFGDDAYSMMTSEVKEYEHA